MVRRRHIGFVTTSFPRGESDFAGRFVFELARAFAREGFGVDLVVPASTRACEWSKDAPWLEGVAVHPVSYAYPRRYQRLFFGAGVPDNVRRNPLLAALVPQSGLALAWKVQQLRHRWDSVMSHWLLPSALAAGGVRPFGIRHLAVAHSGDVHLLTKPMLAPMSRALYWTADTFGFISQALRSRFLNSLSPRLRERFRSRAVVTPMGIDARSLKASMSRATARRRLGVSRFVLLFLGRLVPIKGLPVLIDAAAGLDDVEILVAGDGPCLDAISAAADARGVTVRFIGAVAPERRSMVMAASDALVLPSLTLPGGRCEGLPLAVLEAMSAGVPVIASDTGGVGELVRHGQSGWLFPEGRSAELREGIVRLKSDAALRTAFRREAGRIADARDWERLLPLYESLLFGE